MRCSRSAAVQVQRASEARPHPQLLDRGAHRPRQVDPGRPHPRGDRDAHRARDARAGARLDGARARTRHHDQGPGRARRLEGPPAQPDRHAGPRGLHLRGLARAAGVRGRSAPRRRGPGDPGADARERLPRARERPRDRPGREQDRPPAGRPGRCRPPRWPTSSARTLPARAAHLGEDRGRGRRHPRRGRRAHPSARGRSRRSAARARLRLLLRPVPRRRRLRPRRRRTLPHARRSSRDGGRAPASRRRSSASSRRSAARPTRSRPERSAMWSQA